MPQRKADASSKQGLFPAILAIASLGLGLAAYFFVTKASIRPYYMAGLFYGVPFLGFLLVTLLAAKGRIKKAVLPLCIFLIVLFSVVMLALTFLISLHAATTPITDVRYYERTLALSHYPDNLAQRHFPPHIPEDASDVSFRFTQALAQGGKDLALRFRASPQDIEDYAEVFAHKASWVGALDAPDANDHGVFDGTLPLSDDAAPPADTTVYVLFSQPDQPDNWNHGIRCMVAISRQQNEILFLASDW